MGGATDGEADAAVVVGGAMVVGLVAAATVGTLKGGGV